MSKIPKILKSSKILRGGSKKNTFTILLAAVFVIAGCSQAEEKIYPYSFNSVKIEFALSGNMEGTKTLYITGNKSVIETHAVRKGETAENIDTLYIDNGASVYTVDLNTKKAVSSGNPVYDALKKLAPGKRMDYLVNLATGNSLSAPSPKPSGQKTVAGQTCDLYDLEGLGQTCIWNGIGLYTSIKIPEAGIDNSAAATKIELNISVPDSKFELPSDVKVQAQEAAKP